MATSYARHARLAHTSNASFVCKITKKFQPPNNMNENIQKIIKNILRDIQVELKDKFDQNFERQAFFSEAWQRRKSPTRPGGHILVDTGQLRRSIKSKTTENSVIFYTDLPYAAIHNEGGDIIVTQKMKRFFWHKYYEATGAFSRKKTGKSGKFQQPTKKPPLCGEVGSGLCIKQVYCLWGRRWWA